ncbi:hypothetical protein V6255_04530 [Psychromonas arctica]|uniref:Uncharacterized protein n=1 Tax=Psychromonas arctica TaxID=168275 RepID=A0ABU9H9W6_9GAMM
MDKKAIRCAFFFGYFHLGKQKKVTRRQGENTEINNRDDWTSADEPSQKVK